MAMTVLHRHLHPLTQFHLPSLDVLDVKNAQWSVWRGNTQLTILCPIVAARAQTLTLLLLDVRCSELLLGHMLTLAPVLGGLWLGLAHPNALSKAFFRAFIVRKPRADSVAEVVGPPSRTTAPLCPSLKSLHLHYRRWMRGPDKKALVVALSDIVGSRNLESKSSFSLSLSFDEALKESYWTIGKPVRKVRSLEGGDLILGIPTSHATIPMSTLLPKQGSVSLPFKKAESLHLFAGVSTSLESLSIHDYMKLMVYGHDRPPPPSSPPCALPLFYALRVLDIKCDNPSFLAGHTFHNLERCRLLKEDQSRHTPGERMLTETGMPVCTRVDIDDPWVLAALKLPQIRRLALDFSAPNCGKIWEKQIAMNSNLSGLNLLNLKNWPSGGDMIPILRSVPLLETLIITTTHGLDSFRAFLPMDANGTARLKGIRTTFAILCPRLWHLHIESCYIIGQPDQVPFAKDIITTRAEYGSPLKVFTFFASWPKPGRKFELIGKDGALPWK